MGIIIDFTLSSKKASQVSKIKPPLIFIFPLAMLALSFFNISCNSTYLFLYIFVVLSGI